MKVEGDQGLESSYGSMSGVDVSLQSPPPASVEDKREKLTKDLVTLRSLCNLSSVERGRVGACASERARFVRTRFPEGEGAGLEKGSDVGLWATVSDHALLAGLHRMHAVWLKQVMGCDVAGSGARTT